MASKRVLITGAGGLAGVNFVRAIRASKSNFYLVGTDNNKFHVIYPDVDARYLTPRHDDPKFVGRVAGLVRRERIDFLHPQPSSEALVISLARTRIPTKVFLPLAREMKVAQDKLASQRALLKAGVPVASTRTVGEVGEVRFAFVDLGTQVWVRARHGAGGRLSLLCRSADEARHWVALWTLRGTAISELLLQEYLPGRNIAWDSIWHDGRLVTSYARERLEYPFKHISPSGITGTPSVARTVQDDEVNRISVEAVRAISPRPHGAYSVDLKGASSGRVCVTEVDAGKFHSTMPLWGYAAVTHLGLPWFANFAELYVRLGLFGKLDDDVPPTDALPVGYYLLRDMDVGAFLWREDGWKQRVL